MAKKRATLSRKARKETRDNEVPKSYESIIISDLPSLMMEGLKPTQRFSYKSNFRYVVLFILCVFARKSLLSVLSCSCISSRIFLTASFRSAALSTGLPITI
jgi:hypothetical protein